MQAAKVRAMQDREETLNILKDYESFYKNELAYQENIFHKYPRLQALIADFDTSTADLRREEAKLKRMLLDEH
jgi:hypothetical protein